MLPNIQSHFRKVKQGTLRNPDIAFKLISPALFETVSAALLLLEMEVIAQVWVMPQLEAYMTPLLATVLQLIEQFNVWLPI